MSPGTSNDPDPAPPAPGLPSLPTFLIGALATCVPLWIVQYLPMTDLPQHAAQLFLWIHYDDPAFDVARYHEIHWFTPYLLGYALARIVTWVTTIPVALKVMVTLSIVGFAAALHWLLRQAGRDPVFAVIGFPLAMGYNFYWGLYSYMVALPLGLIYLGLVIRFADSPTRRRALGVTVAGVLLFFSHLLVLGLALLAGILWILLQPRRKASIFRLLAPLLVTVPLAGVWMAVTSQGSPSTQEPVLWGASPLGRAVGLPGTLLGERLDAEAELAGLILIALVILSGRPGREWHRYGPFVGAVLLYLLAPIEVFGNKCTYGRFAVFILPFWLLVLEAPRRPWVRPIVIHLGLVGLVLCWMSVLVVRFRGFDADARKFDDIARHIEPNRRVVSVNYHQLTDWVPFHAPFGHFVAYSQARVGGLIGYSFASCYAPLVRYRPGAAPRTTPYLEWRGTRFSWETDGGFDYYVVRTPPDTAATPFVQGPPDLHLVARSGLWWLYRRDQPR